MDNRFAPTSRTSKSTSSSSKSKKSRLLPKIFECLFCKKGFRWRWHLELHMHKHTGEKPYFCSQCDLCLSSATARALHQQGVHLGIKYKCDLCSSIFTQMGNLLTHRKNIHGLNDTKLERKMLRVSSSFTTRKNNVQSSYFARKANAAKKESPKDLMNHQGSHDDDGSPSYQRKYKRRSNVDFYHNLDTDIPRRPIRLIHDASFFLHLNRYTPDE